MIAIKNGDLSAKQKAVYDMITKEFLTVKEMAIKLNISGRAVYKLICKIKQKGYLMDAMIPTSKHEKQKGSISGAWPPLPNLLRIHGQQFKINVIKVVKTHLFDKFIGKNFRIHGNLIRIWKDCIEVYGNKDHIGFIGATEAEAEGKAFAYWLDIIYQLEAGLGVVLAQEGIDNIRMVKCHYAHINNGIAFNYHSRKEILRVTGRDGKLWLDIDNSKGLYELELRHPGRAATDSRLIGRYVNDLRERQPSTNSQLDEAFVIHLKHDHGYFQEKKRDKKQETLRPDYFG